jgi:hypothetical protein
MKKHIPGDLVNMEGYSEARYPELYKWKGKIKADIQPTHQTR